MGAQGKMNGYDPLEKQRLMEGILASCEYHGKLFLWANTGRKQGP